MEILNGYLKNWRGMWSFANLRLPIGKRAFLQVTVTEFLLYFVCALVADTIGVLYAPLSLLIGLLLFTFALFSMRRFISVGIPRILAVPMFIGPFYLFKYLGIFGLIAGLILLGFHFYITVFKAEKKQNTEMKNENLI
ncbi:hypothetical protein FEZ34_14325 [Lacticaseibacillus casei]|uniref:hypothetical protein n=1 Tax=Lacticaseibacillus casei TaxID=1582 RepID=UPI00110938BB|nr:hypothetical protein [Lacticaseibacillus casei]TLQ49662.1 hypothetical protein FEZ34_14325 [Lacticaseibacillus casei]